MNDPKPGDLVILTQLPPGLLDGLPEDDQRAIRAIVGRPVVPVEYDDLGLVELEFDDPFEPRTEISSHTHSIWVAPEFIEPYEPA